MGYALYELPTGRLAGYAVQAQCDFEHCPAEIDRGLGYLCGRLPDGHRDDDEPGCGRYFCGEHQVTHDCPNPESEEDDDEPRPRGAAGDRPGAAGHRHHPPG